MSNARSVLQANDHWAGISAVAGFQDAAGVAADSTGRVYVITRDAEPVIVFGSDGHEIERWPRGIVSGVHGITIGPDDLVYLTDHVDHVVRVFTPDGTLHGMIGQPGVFVETGYRPGVSPVMRAGGAFNRPTNLAVDSDGSLLITDGYGNARVHRFGAEGRLVDTWGAVGDGPGEFNLPHGIAVTERGTILVADRENSRILLFTGGGEQIDEWTFVNRPSDLAVGRDGLVYIAGLSVPADRSDTPHQRYALDPRPGTNRSAEVTVCDMAGTVLLRLGPGRVGNEGTFISPHGLCLDPAGNLYIAELAGTIGTRDGIPAGIAPALQRFEWSGLAATGH